MSMYSIDNFATTYIEYDFDSQLLDIQNELINSNKHYLDIKNNYLQQTKENFNKFQELQIIHNDLSNNHNITTDNNVVYHSYKFVNKYNLNEINDQIKTLLKNQQYIFDNFNHYISFINSTEIVVENIYHGDINQPRTIKINNKKALNFV